jgi:hydroxyquinol 1,2-dioxygenase
VRNFDEYSITAAVRERVGQASNARVRQISDALARYLHNFVREIEPTLAEWFWAIDFLTRTGQMCDQNRQEFHFALGRARRLYAG